MVNVQYLHKPANPLFNELTSIIYKPIRKYNPFQPNCGGLIDDLTANVDEFWPHPISDCKSVESNGSLITFTFR